MRIVTCVLLALVLFLVGCGKHAMKVVTHGSIKYVESYSLEDGTQFMSLEDVRPVLTALGAVVDVNYADHLLTIAYPKSDKTPEEWPAPLPGSEVSLNGRTSPLAMGKVVFNDAILDTQYLMKDGRAYLPLKAFTAICKAMGKRISPPPYTEVMAVAPKVGEEISTGDPTNGGKGKGLTIPSGKGGH